MALVSEIFEGIRIKDRNKIRLITLKISSDIEVLPYRPQDFNTDDPKIGKRNLVRAFAQALEKVEIKDFTFHCLRHTFATRLAQNGVDIYKTAKLLNHKDLKNTQRYSHYCPESLMFVFRFWKSLTTSLLQWLKKVVENSSYFVVSAV